MPLTLDPPDVTVTAGPSRAAVVAGLLPIQSVVAVDPWGLAPFGPLRWMLMSATLLLTVVLARGPVRLPRMMGVAWAVVLVTMTVATITALDPLHAVIGTPERRLGLLAWVGLAAAFVIGATLCTRQDRRHIVRTMAVAGCLLAISAAADALGWLPDSGFTERVGGAYGQPAYLAAMATLVIPPSVALAVDRLEIPAWRSTAAAAALGGAGALLASGTRGAWLGLAAGALPLLVRAAGALPLVMRGAALPGARRADRRVLLGLALVAVLALAGVVRLTPVGPRALSGLDTSQGTAAGRLAEWRVAGRVIADRPWLGTGPEGYRIAFPAVVDVDYGRTYGREVFPDRAHNSLLDVTATGGVGAGAAWLVLLAGVGLLGLRGTRSDDPVQIGAGVAVIAYAAQQQLLFPLAEIDPVWWLLVGMLAGPGFLRRAVPPEGAHPDPDAARALFGRPDIDTSVRLLAMVLLLATLIAGTLGVLADREMAQALDLARPPTTQAALATADAATTLRPDDIRLWFAAARIAVRGDRIVDVDAALDRLDRGLAISPRDPALAAERGALLLDRARRSQLPEDQDAAIDAHRVLVTADPANVGPRIGLATALGYAGRHREAAAVAGQARVIDPDSLALPALEALLGLLERPPEAPSVRSSSLAPTSPTDVPGGPGQDG